MSNINIVHKPVNSLQSPRFSGVRTFMRLPHSVDLTDADAAVFGVTFDTGASFQPGARFGPAAIRDASVMLKTCCPVANVDMSQYLSILDYGDIDTAPGYIEDSFERIEEGMLKICNAGVTPVCMGGDHSISLPLLRALNKIQGGPVALVHFDAHSDTISGYFGHDHNHGTPFYWAIEEGLIKPEHSVQAGIRGSLFSMDQFDYVKGKGVDVISGPELHEIGLAETVRRIRERISGQPVYISFDIDFLDPAYAPGTGTPEIGGFTTHQAQQLVIGVCAGMDLKGMDLVEVMPSRDNAGITAWAGASLIHAFLACLAKNRA